MVGENEAIAKRWLQRSSPPMTMFRPRFCLALLVAGLLAAGTIFPALAGTVESDPIDLSYSDFMARAAAKQVRDVTLRGSAVFGDMTDGQMFRSYMPDDNTAIDRLLADGVTINAEPDDSGVAVAFAMNLIPAVLGVFALLFLGQYFRQRGANQGLKFQQSRAKQIDGSALRVSFAEVAGVDEAREELGEIVQFLKEPNRFQRLGGKVPAGVLLSGPPGTGKTLLARAVAGEAGVPFFSISGSDFVEMFVGVGASRVRDLFAQRARATRPASSSSTRSTPSAAAAAPALGGGNDEREQTLNQLLVEMDGFADERAA